MVGSWHIFCRFWALFWNVEGFGPLLRRYWNSGSGAWQKGVVVECGTPGRASGSTGRRAVYPMNPYDIYCNCMLRSKSKSQIAGKNIIETGLGRNCQDVPTVRLIVNAIAEASHGGEPVAFLQFGRVGAEFRSSGLAFVHHPTEATPSQVRFYTVLKKLLSIVLLMNIMNGKLMRKNRCHCHVSAQLKRGAKGVVHIWIWGLKTWCWWSKMCLRRAWQTEYIVFPQLVQPTTQDKNLCFAFRGQTKGTHMALISGTQTRSIQFELMFYECFIMFYFWLNMTYQRKQHLKTPSTFWSLDDSKPILGKDDEVKKGVSPHEVRRRFDDEAVAKKVLERSLKCWLHQQCWPKNCVVFVLVKCVILLKLQETPVFFSSRW